MNDYGPTVWMILILMVLTGTARTIANKVFYQKGFTDPLLITLLI